jgi:hypothetical protein
LMIEFEFQNIKNNVIPFYYPNKSDLWDKHCRSGCFGNFYSLGSELLTLTLGGVSGKFQTTEVCPRSGMMPTLRHGSSQAAYQAMKWWFDDDARHEFEAAPGTAAGAPLAN